MSEWGRGRRAGQGGDRAEPVLEVQRRPWAFTPRKVGALEGCGQRRWGGA